MAKAKGKKSNNTEKRMAQAKKLASQTAKQNANKKKQKGSRLEYWKGVKLEMSKVIWPTKKELGTYTAVVIATCAVFALGFWAIDSGWLALLKAILGITLS